MCVSPCDWLHIRGEGESDGHRPGAHRERADVEPGVAAVRIEDPAADQRAERHAEARYQACRAEHTAHDLLAEVLAREYRIEWHDAAVGEAEQRRHRIKRFELRNHGEG